MKKLFCILLMTLAAAVGAAEWLGVKFYSDVANPEGIPGEWPAEVVRCATNAAPKNFTLMTVEEYNALRAARLANYLAWEGSLESSRKRKETTEAVSEEAERRIVGLFGGEKEKARARQQQMQARFSELTLAALEAGGLTNLTAAEQAEVAALRAVWGKVKAIRVVEHGKTNAIAGKTIVDVKAGWPEEN